MNRFTNWSSSSLRRLNLVNNSELDLEYKNSYSKKSLKVEIRTDYVGMISSALVVLGVEHIREYKFLEDRRFKFDIAIPEKKIAVEFEGGIFSNGRHTRGKGYSNDAKKYNLATMHGWKLLRYTSADINKLNWEFQIAEEIKRFKDSDLLGKEHKAFLSVKYAPIVL